MKRREFITLIGGAAAAWPRAARAQQSAMPVVGFVSGRSPGSDAYLVEGFRRGLRENGLSEGQNVALEFRWADGQLDRLPAMIAELIERKVNVLFAGAADVAAGGLRVASAIVPVVFATGSDPVETGLVASFNRPGGNLTGVSVITNTLWPKRMELLRELLPATPLIALLVNPTNLGHLSATRELNDAARKLGQEVLILPASVEADFETTFAALVEKRANALIVSDDALFTNRRDVLAALAARHAVPAIYGRRRICQCRRPDELRRKHSGPVLSIWRLCRPHPAGRQTRRFAISAADQVRADAQSKNGQCTRPRRSGDAACARRRGHRMKRREFITLIGGAAAALPRAARAQQTIRRVGMLLPAAADDAEFQTRVGAFLEGLRQSGWTIGQNVQIDSRWATTNAVEIRRHAAELAALAPDAILTSSSPALAALQQATRTAPIVFVNVIDPVGSGFVDSLARPGGNTTGFLLFEYSLSGKWLELLKQIAPNVTRAAVFRDSGNPSGNAQSTCATPARSSAPSRPLCAPRTAV
jgi:ABC-type uncharacterized transport system substrate-binding protein